MNNKNKSATKKINFASIITSVFVPALLALVAIFIAIFAGLNKGIDFTGGIKVEVVADTLNLSDANNYSAFKTSVDKVLNNNGVNGTIYQTEYDSVTGKDTLVVKIQYTDNNNVDSVIAKISSELKTEFFDTVSETEIQNRNLISVEKMGAWVNSYTIVATILASLVGALLIAVYIAIRTGIYSAVLSFVSALASNAFSWILLLITRIQVSETTFLLIPLVTISSMLTTFIFVKKANNELKLAEKYKTKQNSVLANDTINKYLKPCIFVCGFALVAFMAFALANMFNPVVLHLGLALFVSVVALFYTSLFIIPAIFAITFIRKVKKEKVKQVKEQKSMTEEDLYKETDLNNLVSN